MNYFSLALFPFYSYTISMLSFRTGLPQYQLPLSKAQPFHVTLLKIGGIDARSVQKTPAGTVNNIRPCTLFTYTFAMQTCYCIEPPPSVAVLIRRGLFFVKRQRRYTAYFQKILDIKIVGSTITQQLSNSATQQLSNSATQQLSNSATQA